MGSCRFLLLLALLGPQCSAKRAGEPSVPVRLSDANCTRSLRGGVSLFSSTAHSVTTAAAHSVTIFSCGDRAPSVSFLATPPDSWGAVPLPSLAAAANLLYARLHGYDFRFFVDAAHAQARRNPWCRLRSMRHALLQPPLPDAALYLDTDAYIRTNLPLSLDSLRASSKHRAIGQDEGDEERGGICPRLNHATTVLGSRLHCNNKAGDPTQASPMADTQAVFERDPEAVRYLNESNFGLLNTGGGWLELAGRAETIAFLDRWWRLGDTFKGGVYRQAFPLEQRILNVAMAHSQKEREATALLEDTIYNSPRSPCIPHLYAVKNKQEPEYLATLRAVVTQRAAGVVLNASSLDFVQDMSGLLLKSDD